MQKILTLACALVLVSSVASAQALNFMAPAGNAQALTVTAATGNPGQLVVVDVVALPGTTVHLIVGDGPNANIQLQTYGTLLINPFTPGTHYQIFSAQANAMGVASFSWILPNDSGGEDALKFQACLMAAPMSPPVLSNLGGILFQF